MVSVTSWVVSGGFKKCLSCFRWFQLVSGWFQVVPGFSNYDRTVAWNGLKTYCEPKIWPYFKNMVSRKDSYVMFCANWYHLYNFKNVKNTHGGALLLLKLQANFTNFIKSSNPPWVTFTFLKLYKWYQIVERITYVHFQRNENKTVDAITVYITFWDSFKALHESVL